MPESYKSVAGEFVTHKLIEKSRFITTSRHVSGENEARSFIAEVAAKYKDATHNCYAFISDSLGNFPRFSDDGEPQGTAGMPMLEVIKNNNLFEVAVVVTRYFGGIKLGAGGLVRAYAGSVAENLATAKKVIYEMCAENKYTVDYSSVDNAMRFFTETGANIINSEYLNEVVFIVAVKKNEEEIFCKEILNRLNGKVKVQRLREYYFPFPI